MEANSNGYVNKHIIGGRVHPGLPVHDPGVPLAQQVHGQPVKELHGTCLQEQKFCFGRYQYNYLGDGVMLAFREVMGNSNRRGNKFVVFIFF